MSDTRKGPEGPLALTTEDEHPPHVMNLRDRQAAGELILNDVKEGHLAVEVALRRLAYYSASEFNVLRREFPQVVPCFDGARFSGMVLNGFNFARADFTGAQLGGAKFLNCDLTGAQLEGAAGAPAQMENCAIDAPQPSEDAPGAVQKTTRNSGLIDWLNGC